VVEAPTALPIVSTSVFPARAPLSRTQAARFPTAGRFAPAKSRSVTRAPSPKREQQLTRRSSRRTSRLHLAHGLPSPASFVADDPLDRRGHRTRSPRGATCLHNARIREPPRRTRASRATPQNQKRGRVGFFSESFSSISCARSSPKSSRCASSFVTPFRSTSFVRPGTTSARKAAFEASAPA